MTDALMFPYTASNVKEIEAFKVAASLFPFSARTTKLILLYVGIREKYQLNHEFLHGKDSEFSCYINYSKMVEINILKPKYSVAT